MKLALLACMAVVCSNGYAQISAPQTLLRRVSLAASCAASFWDYQTTVAGASYGAVEKNSWMSNSNGQPRLGLMLGVKAGLCGAFAVAQETPLFRRYRKVADPLWTTVNASLAARFAAAAVHNRSVTRQLRSSQAAAVPSYLAAGQ